VRGKLLLIVCLVALLVLTAVRIKALKTLPPPSPNPGLPVEVAAVSRGPVTASLNYAATVEADFETSVAAKVAAPVKALLAKEGQLVRAGQLLALLDETELARRAEVLRRKTETARLQTEHLARELARQQFLFQQGAISAQAYDQAQFLHESARSNLREAEAAWQEAAANLEYVRLHAPADGFVKRIYRYPGDVTVPGQPVLSLLATQDLKIRVRVLEKDLSHLRVGTKALVTFESERTSFVSSVERIDPFLDPKARTAAVDIALPPELESAIVPGASCRVAFVLAEKENVLRVPKRAVLESDGTRYVYVVLEGKAVRRPVVTGVAGEEFVEVVDGLGEGEKVVLTGLRQLYDGRPVYVWGEEMKER